MNTQFLAAFMGLGGPEMIWIFVIILLLFGAKKLPEFARGLGKSMGEFKKARSEFEDEIHRAGTESGLKEARKEAEEEISRARGELRSQADKDLKV